MQHKIWGSVDNIESLFSAKTSQKLKNPYISSMHKNPLPSFPWQLLLTWYEEHGRHHLPWRDYTHIDLWYRVWLSEILLQQTQVDRVIPFYQKMLDKYPTVQSLAWASYEEFFPYYQGLGYYSRARNILHTAGLVSREYQWIFPRDKKSLMTLPGVWWYTSSAILAFAYGEPYLSWDTNLEKVFARYYHGSKILKHSELEKEEIEKDFRDFVEKNQVRKSDEMSQKQEVRGRKIFSKRVYWWVHDWEINFSDKEIQSFSGISRGINNALMDFASMIDLKNPSSIDWDHHPIPHGLFYETRGGMEPQETKVSQSFPIPDATVVVILHQDHRVYYSAHSWDSDKQSKISHRPSSRVLGIEMTGTPISYLLLPTSYSPFILPPSLDRDTRRYVQEYFRNTYALELSVRPIHKKWLSIDGKPYIAVNAQIQAGDASIFEQHKKSDMKISIEQLYSL